MKHLFILAILVFSLVSQANTMESVFSAHSPIPQDLKTLILKKVQETFPTYLTPNGLIEEETSVHTQKIDQGQIDYFFATTFSSRYMDCDGHYPRYVFITVHSAEYAIYNPVDARYQVLDLSVEDLNCQ